MLNKVILQGRCGNDPEKRTTGAGVPVTTVDLAVDRDFADKTSGKKETDWIKVVAWRETANFLANYFTKGRMVVVDGRLQMRKWTDKDGNKRTTAEVIAEHVYFGDSKRDSSGSYAMNQTNNYQSSDFTVLEDSDDSLPF